MTRYILDVAALIEHRYCRHHASAAGALKSYARCRVATILLLSRQDARKKTSRGLFVAAISMPTLGRRYSPDAIAGSKEAGSCHADCRVTLTIYTFVPRPLPPPTRASERHCVASTLADKD